ncbi:DUF3379 family protein [Neptunicella marina]|uniref:DUF3379 domain-containing protein n=1 Tax=Neptunicella marina TaxID=2125989 RepID=A0A8J6IWE5_9ALTE|nr:DUF3379 family protein [Neptunicella marina]MBC3766736.1 DUF3379 domain-containing protein [Neptunicella marina]
MDDLEFRRTIYADPDSQLQSVKDAVQSDKSKQQFWHDVKQLDKNIKQTVSDVAVPEGLAHRLILKQSLAEHRSQKIKQRWYIALAASIAFLVGINVTIFNNQPIDISEYALAHRYHEGEVPMQMDENVNLQQVNIKLAAMGGHLNQDIGKVYFANFCDFDRVRSLHLVMDSGNGKVTVFVVPLKEQFSMEPKFADQRFDGRSFDIGNAAIIVVGEKGQELKLMEDNLKKQLVFSA